MKHKNFMSVLLLVFVIGSIIYLGFNEYSRKQPAGSDNPMRAVIGEQARETGSLEEAEGKTPSHKVIAYYFHGKVRCQSCRSIEEYSHEAVTERFSKELEKGLLEWRVVNIQEPGNEHFRSDYKLSFWSLILVDTRDGRELRWKNCEKVWDLLGDPEAFSAYVQKEISDYLEEG